MSGKLKKFFLDTSLRIVSTSIDVNPMDNLLIFGDPRGGTTWVTEMVQRVIKRPILWEPLSINHVKHFREIGFGWRQYIPETEKWPEAIEIFDRLFKGKILNSWIVGRTDLLELIHANSFLIKFCRGSSLLPWINANFKLRYKPIYIIRHPFAVVSSQLKHSGWDFEYSKFHIPQIPYNEMFKDHQKYLQTLNTKEQALTAMWCIHNIVPLKHPKNNVDWITINYEELLFNPYKTFKRIGKEWNLQFELLNLNVEKPSSTTVNGSPISGKRQLEYWDKTLGSNQIEKMMEVLDYFQIQEYTSNYEPNIIYH